jgi:hypothetical protein
MSLTRPEFSRLIMEYVALQSGLQSELIRDNKIIKDCKYLIDLPRRGSVNVNGALWQCYRHGLGVRFEFNGIIVDVHNLILEDGIVDAHRISEYIRSKYKVEDDSGLYGECEEELENAERDGVISRVGKNPNTWRLS